MVRKRRRPTIRSGGRYCRAVAAKIRQDRDGCGILRQDRRTLAGGADVLWQQLGPPCARIDYLKEYAGLDVQKMYPGPDAARQGADRQLDLGNFLDRAEKCAKGGHPFGLGLSTCTDAINVAGSVLHAYGAQMVDAKGNITVKSDATRQVLEWYKRLAKTMPESVYAYDNASNNKALVSGKAALIMNPPSAYAVATRDRPEIAKQLWTFPSPKGPKGGSIRRAIITGGSGTSRKIYRRRRAFWPI